MVDIDKHKQFYDQLLNRSKSEKNIIVCNAINPATDNKLYRFKIGCTLKNYLAKTDVQQRLKAQGVNVTDLNNTKVQGEVTRLLKVFESVQQLMVAVKGTPKYAYVGKMVDIFSDATRQTLNTLDLRPSMYGNNLIGHDPFAYRVIEPHAFVMDNYTTYTSQFNDDLRPEQANPYHFKGNSIYFAGIDIFINFYENCKLPTINLFDTDVLYPQYEFTLPQSDNIASMLENGTSFIYQSNPFVYLLHVKHDAPPDKAFNLYKSIQELQSSESISKVSFKNIRKFAQRQGWSFTDRTILVKDELTATYLKLQNSDIISHIEKREYLHEHL